MLIFGLPRQREFARSYVTRMATTTYEYESLDLSTTSFRLLQVQPSSDDGIVRCTLRVALIEQSDFRALSYVWYPADDPSSNQVREISLSTHPDSTTIASNIEVNGKSALIGDNLLRFIKVAQIQYANSDFWIDALCIDQDNLREQNHQVGKMGQIFSSAREVLAWLGSGDRDTDIFLNFVGSHHNSSDYSHIIDKGLLTKDVLKGGVLDLDFDHAARCRACQKAEIVGPGCLKVLKNQYWDRLWIVQEVLLAKRVLVKCGLEQVPLDHIIAPFYYRKEDMISFLLHVTKGQGLGILKLMKGVSNLHRADLYEMVGTYRQQLCARTHDRIYALLAVSRDGRRIEINYRWTTSQLVQHVLERAAMPSLLCGPIIAECVESSPAGASYSLPDTFLDRKIRIRGSQPYVPIGYNKDEIPGHTFVKGAGRIFRYAEEECLKVEPCQSADCSAKAAHEVPAKGDIILVLPCLGLKAVFRIEKARLFPSLITLVSLRFVCCVEKPRVEYLRTCSIANDLHARLATLRPVVHSWQPGGNVDVEMNIDWRTVFLISKYSVWAGYLVRVHMHWPKPEPRWSRCLEGEDYSSIDEF